MPLTLGVAMTLALAGYRFGESNHGVYLVDALRHNDSNLLTNDWWTRSTLQYHVIFTRVSAALMRTGLIEPAFLAGYVLLAVLWHVAWRRLTFALGGDDAVYLVSVILFLLMAGGTGLGMYHFLQDSSFLPSNVANVAMLWGVSFLVQRRAAWAGLALGIAGLFHLNHALVGIAFWFGVEGIRRVRTRRGEGVKTSLAGASLVVGLSLPAILPAIRAVMMKTNSLPLSDFVALYVRLRHPHHYDPSSWPAALWLTFLLPIVAAVFAPPMRRCADVFVLFVALLIIALLGAGVWYVSEPLIQMSLYRFSVFPKLLSCIGAAWLLWQSHRAKIALRALVMGTLVILTVTITSCLDLPPHLRDNVFPVWLFALLATAALLRPRVLGWGKMLFGALTSACVVVSLVVSWSKLGIRHDGLRGDDAAYLTLCDWAAANTPVDAVFVVPPDEQSFRLRARRAIVVNFKNVPQLSGELGEWRDRLQHVLDLDVTALPKPFHRTQDAMRARYAEISAEHLASVAHRYGARYIVSVRPLDTRGTATLVFSGQNRTYFLYDLGGPAR